MHVTSLLSNIQFLYDSVECHWAETDGSYIWLNIYKPWTTDLLFWTLVHECIHGIITIHGRELTEWKEHKIMRDVDSNIV